LNSFFLNPCFSKMSKISGMSLLGRWLEKKKPDYMDRVARSSASPSAVKASYN